MIRTPMGALSFRIDLHVHSLLSGDNSADPEDCIVRAIAAGLQGLAFTEHYTYAASKPLEPLIERYRGKILVLRAVEFSVEEGHCLVFGADPDRLCEPYAPAAELVREVNRAGGAVIPSHPHRTCCGLGRLVLELPGIAAVEGLNGCNLDRDNQLAIEDARRARLPCTGGSDAHRPEDVGLCYTEFTEPVTAENLVGLLKAGRYRPAESEKRKKFSRGLRRGAG